MAKAKILEITLSVIGTAEDGYPNPDLPQIANTAGDSASSDRLVISVRIRGAKKYARYKAGSPRTGG